MQISKNNTMAFIIDYQERLVPVMHEREKLIHNSLKLIEGLERLEIPLLITQQYTKGLGMTLPEVMKVSKVQEYIEKNTFSCFKSLEVVNKILAMSEVKNIILCGIEAHICVLQTTLDLLKNAYQVILVEDCISSRQLNDKVVAMRRMEQAGASVTTHESILYEIMESSQAPQFKDISKLIK